MDIANFFFLKNNYLAILVKKIINKILKGGLYMNNKCLFMMLLLTMFLLPFAVFADTIVSCPDCAPAIADTFPHNGKYGLGTRYFFLHNRWHKDLIVHVNGSCNGCNPAWTNLTFTLKIGKDTIIQIPNKFASARIWGQWNTKYNGPFTLAEMTLSAGWKCDWYNVSLVDGYNLPIIFKPVPGTFPPDDPALDAKYGRPSDYTCGQAGCETDLYLTAPASMLKLDTVNGIIDTNGIYCQDNTQCRTLKKTACPKAYSWAFDDPTSLFTCPSPELPGYNGNGPDYIIYFGLPSATYVVNNNNLKINKTIIENLTITITKNKDLKYFYCGQKPAWLEIYSCMGKLMIRIKVEEAGSIAVPKLNRGTYIVSIRRNNEITTRQLMVWR